MTSRILDNENGNNNDECILCYPGYDSSQKEYYINCDMGDSINSICYFDNSDGDTMTCQVNQGDAFFVAKCSLEAFAQDQSSAVDACRVQYRNQFVTDETCVEETGCDLDDSCMQCIWRETCTLGYFSNEQEGGALEYNGIPFAMPDEDGLSFDEQVVQIVSGHNYDYQDDTFLDWETYQNQQSIQQQDAFYGMAFSNCSASENQPANGMLGEAARESNITIAIGKALYWTCIVCVASLGTFAAVRVYSWVRGRDQDSNALYADMDEEDHHSGFVA